MRVSSALCGGHRPAVLEALLAVVAANMAEVQLVQTGQWLASVIAAGIAFSLLGTPLVDGPVSRASEHASDAYAREVGVGRELARALVTVQSGSTAAETAAERRPELVERGRDRRWRRRSRRRRSAGPYRRRRRDGDAVGIAPRQPCRLRRPPRAEVGVDLGEPAVGGHPFDIAPGAAEERLIERRPSPALGVSQQLGAAGHLHADASRPSLALSCGSRRRRRGRGRRRAGGGGKATSARPTSSRTFSPA